MAAMNTAAPSIDLGHLRSWIGRVQTDHDVAALRHAHLMAATIARPGPALQAGEPLPPLWHWLYFLDGLPPADLGRDGHPARGGFLPPVPLPNRMWAGGRVEFEAPIPLGAAIEKRSQVLAIEHKRGRSGELVFVTVQHEVLVAGRRCVREEHDIVYKQAVPVGSAVAPVPAVGGMAAGISAGTAADLLAAAPARAPAAAEAPPPGQHHVRLTPDSTLLFRYSALTFNGHRIHYDLDYCRQVEGYANLVIHGPLVATLLAGLAEQAGGRPLRRFSYRGLRPALLGTTLDLHADVAANQVRVWSILPGGAVSMQAEAELAA